MTTDACATSGCGHAHRQHYGDTGWPCAACSCTAYLPPRPVPEETQPVIKHPADETGPAEMHYDHVICERCAPATVPAPHAEAEAAWEEHAKDHPSVTGIGGADIRKAFIAGYLRGRGDRG